MRLLIDHQGPNLNEIPLALGEWATENTNIVDSFPAFPYPHIPHRSTLIPPLSLGLWVNRGESICR